MESLTELPYGLPGKVYRSPMPYSPGFDPLYGVMKAYREKDVGIVVMLASAEDAERITGRDLVGEYQTEGMDVILAPVQDFSTPDPEIFQQALREALQAARSGQTIAVHCHAGLGRTGMFAACLAKIIFDMDGDEAIAWVRNFIPGAVENERQAQFVRDFELLNG